MTKTFRDEIIHELKLFVSNVNLGYSFMLLYTHKYSKQIKEKKVNNTNLKSAHDFQDTFNNNVYNKKKTFIFVKICIAGFAITSAKQIDVS